MRLLNTIVFLAICVNCAIGARILGVFTTPSYSHQIVYQPIWKELSLRGHDVTVITPHPLKDNKLTNLTEIDVSSVSSVFHSGIETIDERSTFKEMTHFAKMYDQLTQHQLNLPEVRDLISNKNKTFDLLLVEYLYPAMYAFKDLYNCPIVGITSLGLTAAGNEAIGNPKHPALDPDLVMPFSSTTSFQERLVSTLYDVFSRWTVKTILFKKLDRQILQYFGDSIRPIYEINRDFSLVIVNSNLALRNARPTVPNLIEISGIHIKPPKPLPKRLNEFLDNSTEGVIYFSLGSNMKSSLIPEEKLNNLMQVFSELPYKVLWKFEREELPNKPENIRIEKWLPQQDVLGHPNVKLFISQGGIQSMDEAVFNKVPMLVLPVFGDQRYNAHIITNRGAALTIDYFKLTKEDFKRSILELMNNPKYQNNINRLSAIATDQIVPALDKAVWWIEYVLRHDGVEHMQYYGRDVPFYQFYMLDILSFCIICIITVLSLTYLMIKKLTQLLISSRKIILNKMKKKEE